MMKDNQADNVVKKVPKQFAEQSEKRGEEYYDYEKKSNHVWKPGSIYACKAKIGRGKYSQVFDAINLNNSMPCVIKMLKPIKYKKINREIKILQSLAGKQNTIKLLDIVKESDIYCLVFEHVNATNYQTLLSELKPADIKFYMYQILKGLHYCHSQGIMHRDIKPQNIVIDHEKKQLKIIDWGLGEFYLPKKDYNVRVSSRYFKGPELLVSYKYYHYSLDIWSLSVMMAEMIFQKQPFFKGENNNDQLIKVTKTLGTAGLKDYLRKYNIKLDKTISENLKNYPPVNFSQYIDERNQHLAEPAAIDLLQKMMVYDHQARPTAEECMNHPYFADVKKV